jgi:hypothetical protein
MKRLVLLGVLALVMNLMAIVPAHASCDPATLHGTGCTQTIRCLPANVGLGCL